MTERLYPQALRRCASIAKASGDFIRAQELTERAEREEQMRPPTGPIGPVAALYAAERPRSEAEAMLDRAMAILRDARVHSLREPRTAIDLELVARIDQLAAQVETWRASR